MNTSRVVIENIPNKFSTELHKSLIIKNKLKVIYFMAKAEKRGNSN